VRLLVVVSIIAVTVWGCGRTTTPRPTTPGLVAEPHWENLFTPPPELLLVVRPRALRSDAIYGPLLRRVLQLARQQRKIVAADSLLQTMEDADEVLVGVRDLANVDFVVVVRGVPAEIDPGNLVDDKGRLLWTATSGGPVRELASAATPGREDAAGEGSVPLDKEIVEASLFELPARTWVIASGDARARARMSFSHPTLRAVAAVTSPTRATSATSLEGAGADPQAVALVRLSGPALVRRARALRPPGLLAAVGHELASVTVALSAGSDALLRATLSYTSERSVLPAEATLRETASALSGAKPQTFAWLQAVHTRTSSCCVVLETPLPPGLLDALSVSDSGG
jgi:hypothetical protein